MKLRKLLCGSAAALIAVSVPLVGMNAFGEAGAPAATPTGTVETEEAAETAETTEVAVPESPVLSEDEIAHQKYLHGYNYTKKDNAITVSDMSFSTLWDNDRIVIKIKPYTGAVLKDAKLYLTSVSGTWEDKFVKDLSFVDDKDSIIVGDLRDEFDGSVIDDAKLKIVIGEGYDEIYYVQIKSESLTDEHPYDEWIKEANSSGKEEYVFYARNYDYIRDYYSGLLNYYAGDFKGKFVDFMDFSVDITGNATYVVYDTIDDERHVASCNLSTSGSYGGVVGTLNYGSDIQFSVYEAELGAKITLQDVQVIVVDYAGEIDESIDTSVPYTLKNISPFIYSYQYDLSMLPPQYGKLTIEFEPAESGDGLRLNGCDYYGSEIDLKVPVDQGQTSAEIYVNKPEMEILRNTTMHLYSENLKITKVTFVHEPRDPSIFEYGDNNCELTLDSKNEYIYIPGSAFEELSEKGSSPVTITFETDSSVSDPWVQYRYGLSDLHKITSVEHVKGKTTYKADLFGSVPEVKEKGLYIFGNGVTITNVNIYKGNPCTGGDPDVIEELTPEEVKDVEFVDSFESENQFTSTTNGFGINKMYSQKNELGNGKYNQRFIMQVKTADVADIYSYSIIISSGTKNVKINCYGLSSSITINGNNIKADEGCVFLSAAVVDVNDSVELSYSDFTYEHGGVVDEA